MIILAVMGYAILVIFELKPLYKQKLWRDFWADMVLGIFSFAIAALLCLNVKLPSPVKPIEKFIISIFGK